MTHLFKRMAMGAAFIAASAAAQAHAGSGWQFTSGSGTWMLFEGPGQWPETPMYQLALDGTGVYMYTEGADNKAQYHYIEEVAPDFYTDKMSLAFTGGSIGQNQLKTVTSQGSQLVFQRTAVRNATLTFDSTVTWSDFVFNLDAKSLSARVASKDLLTGQTTDHGFRTLLTATGMTGGGVGNGLATFSTTGPLLMDDLLIDTMLTSLGLPLDKGSADFQTVRYLWDHADWGVFSGQAVFSAVPEPSAYLSALAGIAVLGVARLRQRKAA